MARTSAKQMVEVGFDLQPCSDEFLCAIIKDYIKFL